VYVIVFPLPDIVPPLTDHVTAVLLELLTVAAKVVLAPEVSEAVAGLMLTAMTGDAVTVTFADAFFVVSATLVAVTM
jgi:hypothetical protein